MQRTLMPIHLAALGAMGRADGGQLWETKRDNTKTGEQKGLHLGLCLKDKDERPGYNELTSRFRVEL